MAIQTMIRARVPVFLWGPPGVGKSQITAQVAAAMGRPVVDIRAVQFDPVDLRGLPVVNGDGQTHWSVPAFLPQATRDGKAGVLFLDELNAAPASVQAACYQLVLDRRLGEYQLPEGWDIVAAGNRETDRGVVNRMPTPLANRFAHFEVTPDGEDWAKWAVKSGIRAEVIAFLRFRPELLHQFDPSTGEKAFPTPRSWEFVSRAIEAAPPAEIELQVYSAIVGQGAALELTGFLRVFRHLPSIDSILMDPSGAKVPTDPATLYALSGALARRAKDDNLDRLWTYVQRLPAEFTVLTMADTVRRQPELQHTGAFVDFGVKFSDFVL
jgi:hypothetical protein